MAYILLVEDTQDNRAIAELILRDAGHTVFSVADGESSMAAAASPTTFFLCIGILDAPINTASRGHVRPSAPRRTIRARPGSA